MLGVYERALAVAVSSMAMLGAAAVCRFLAINKHAKLHNSTRHNEMRKHCAPLSDDKRHRAQLTSGLGRETKQIYTHFFAIRRLHCHCCHSFLEIFIIFCFLWLFVRPMLSYCCHAGARARNPAISGIRTNKSVHCAASQLVRAVPEELKRVCVHNLPIQELSLVFS